jgi:hypothetical protein
MTGLHPDTGSRTARDAERLAAWTELLRVLPAGWAASRPFWRADDGMWVVHARSLGLARPRLIREAYGASETIALRALAQQFRIERRLDSQRLRERAQAVNRCINRRKSADDLSWRDFWRFVPDPSRQVGNRDRRSEPP